MLLARHSERIRGRWRGGWVCALARALTCAVDGSAKLLLANACTGSVRFSLKLSLLALISVSVSARQRLHGKRSFQFKTVVARIE